MITETDQQLLDEYLDGQLSSADAQRLTRRLSAEPALAEELAALKADRMIRQSVLAALEAQPAEASAFSRRVVSAARRSALRARVMGFSRIAGGIAACIVIGFAAGWVVRDHTVSPQPVAATVVQNSSANKQLVAEAKKNNDTIRTVAQSGALTGPFQVSLTDSSGRVVAVQKFDRLEDANAAAEAMKADIHDLSQPQPNLEAEQVADSGQL